MEIVDDSLLLNPPPPLSPSHLPQQSPDLCSHNSTSISLSSSTLPACLTSECHSSRTHLHQSSATTFDCWLGKVTAEGTLDLSKNQLTALSDGGTHRRGHEDAARAADGEGEEHPTQIVQLIVAQNSLRSLDCASLPLRQCTEIDASQNELSQMRCFFPLANILVHLNLSDNRINSLGSLNSFCCLQTLDLSHNRIEHFPVIDRLTQLRYLNLASNHIKAVPNLCRLTSLEELDLHGNAIKSLDSVRNLLPSLSLRSLDIGANLLSDLTEFHHLNKCELRLSALTVMGNPCTRTNNVIQRKFSYRPFIFSCVLGDLKLLDGFFLSDPEILEGEWLHTQGQSRSFRPGTAGNHAKLCAYLEQLATSDVTPMEHEKRAKMIQKMREYNRSQSSTILTAQIDENALRMDEQQKSTDREMKANRWNSSKRQQTPADANRKTPTSGRRTPQPLNASTTTPAAKGITRRHSHGTEANSGKKSTDGAQEEEEQQHQLTPLVSMAKSVVQCVSQQQLPREGQKSPTKEPTSQSMLLDDDDDGFDTFRTACKTFVGRPPVSPARTVVLSTSSVEDDSSKDEQTDQQLHPPPPVAALSTAVNAQFGSPVVGTSSPISSRIPVNVSSLTARTLRHRHVTHRNVVHQNQTTSAAAIQSQQPQSSQHQSSSSSSVINRPKTLSKSLRKTMVPAHASLAKSKSIVDWNEESEVSSKNSRKKGRLSNFARKFNIRRKPSSGRLQPQPRFTPAPAATSHASPGTIRHQKLHHKVDELVEHCSLQMGVYKSHAQTLEAMAEKIKQLETEMSVRNAQDRHLRSLLIPTPAKLVAKWRGDGEKGNAAVDISWENVNPLVDAVESYELYLNGQPFEPVRAKFRRLRITDLSPAEDLKISIRAISSLLDGIRSAPCETTMTKCSVDEEGKENGGPAPAFT